MKKLKSPFYKILSLTIVVFLLFGSITIYSHEALDEDLNMPRQRQLGTSDFDKLDVESLPSQSAITPMGASGQTDQPDQPGQLDLGTSISSRALIPIDATTVAVTTFPDFKAAIEGNNGYTNIILKNNITMTSGVIININKPYLVIDGEDVNTLTDYRGGLNGTINIASNNHTTKKVTLRNMDVNGYNYYGTVGVPQSSTFSDVELVYDNIVYDGPQLSYNGYGTVRYINSDITIRGGSSFYAGSTGLVAKTNADTTQELAEANKVYFEGDVRVVHTASGDSLIWFRGANPTITFASGSSVVIESTRMGMFYNDSNPIVMDLYEGSDVLLRSSGGFSRTAQAFNEVNVLKGASLAIESVAQLPGVYPFSTKYVNIDDSASFSYKTNNPTQLQILAGGSFVANNPERVKFFSSNVSYAPIRFASTGNFYVYSADAINYWSSVPSQDSDTMTNTPSQIWNKAEGQINLNGTISSGNWSSIYHNIDMAVDPVDSVPNSSNTSLLAMRMMVIGQQVLDVDPLLYASTALTGTTLSSSPVRATFTQNSTPYQVNSTADSSGKFSLNLGSVPFPTGEVIVTSHNKLLKIRKFIELDKTLQFSHVPASVNFQSSQVPATKSTYYRTASDPLNDYVGVLDLRGSGNSWKVMLSSSSIEHQTLPHTLKGNLLYVKGGTTHIISSTPSLILNGSSASTPTEHRWTSNDGLLLEVAGGGARVGDYSATLSWDLVNAP